MKQYQKVKKKYNHTKLRKKKLFRKIQKENIVNRIKFTKNKVGQHYLVPKLSKRKYKQINKITIL